MHLESTIEDHFCKRVSAAGGETWKTTVLGRVGFPDRTAIFPGGVVWFVELKRPRGGRVAEHQKEWHRRLRAMGCTVLVLKTKQEVDQCFERLEQGFDPAN